MNSLEQRIARLEAMREIEALGMRYCLAVDAGDMDGLADLFCMDAHFAMPALRVSADGRAAIRQCLAAQIDAIGGSLHWTHDRLVQLGEGDDAGTARGMVMAHAEVAIGAQAHVAAIRYDDVYRRDADRWRFARRSLGFRYYLPITEYAARFDTQCRVRAGDEWLAGDPPVVAGL